MLDSVLAVRARSRAERDAPWRSTGRTALLALARRGRRWSPRRARSTCWPGSALLAVCVAVDLALAGSVRRPSSGSDPATPSVRLGEPVEVDADRSTNPGGRRVRGRAARRLAAVGRRRARTGTRSTCRPASGAGSSTTLLTPTRRGDRPADRVTVRSRRPAGARRPAAVGTPCRGGCGCCRRSARAGTCPSRLARLRELDGRTSVNVRGQGTEFDSLREYVVGDDVRSIDWRATARPADVVVRTWRPERDRHVLLVPGHRRAPAPAGSATRRGWTPPWTPRCCSPRSPSRAGDRVDLLAADRRVRAARRRAQTGSQLLPALVEAMAPLEPELLEADCAAVVGAIRARTSQRSLVVLLTAAGVGLGRGEPAAGAGRADRAAPGRRRLGRPTRRSAAMAGGRGDADAVYARRGRRAARSPTGAGWPRC